MESMVRLMMGAAGAPRRIVVAVGVSVCIAAGLAGPLGPLAYAHRASKGGAGTVEEVKAEPTSLAISLASEGPAGPDISVTANMAVRAGVTLEGANAASARGAIEYKVYSDPTCTTEVAWSGPRPLGNTSASRRVRLRSGTYFWQAAYAGDNRDAPSTSQCGAAVETVTGDPQIASCTDVSGKSVVSTEAGELRIRESLSSDLSVGGQELIASWSGGHRLHLTDLLNARCTVRRQASVFVGVGDAKLNGVPGYHVRVRVRVDQSGEESIRLTVRNPKDELVADLTSVPAPGSETIG